VPKTFVLVTSVAVIDELCTSASHSIPQQRGSELPSLPSVELLPLDLARSVAPWAVASA